jgi:hypothetical protein
MNNANENQTQNENKYKFIRDKCYNLYLGEYRAYWPVHKLLRANRPEKYVFQNLQIDSNTKLFDNLDKIEEIPCKPQDNLVTTGGYIKKNIAKNKSKKNKSKKSSKKVKSKKQKSKKNKSKNKA